MEKVCLFCFPYAGGASASYNSWRQFLNGTIQLRAVELAARGRRMRESNYNSLHDAVDDVYNIIKEEISTTPYVFFGHSMGSVIALELAHKIRENNLPGPRHIFFSGRAAPQVPRANKRTLHHLPDDQFKEEIMKLGGTPKEFFEYPELMEVFLPLLKGDFRVTETYVHEEKDSPLACSITVFSGKQDEDTPEDVEAWKVHTTGTCDFHYFEGGHFFLHDETEKVVGIISDTVNRVIAGGR
jgi:surfactin synthase thioesterase subunit